MWITDLQKNDLFYALKAASFGIQKIIEHNFNNYNQEGLLSDKKFGIISTEIIQLNSKKIALVFSSLFQEGLKHPELFLGLIFKDYNENKSYQIIKWEGLVNKEINVSNKSKKIEYSMPLDVFCFEVKEVEVESTTFLNTLINNNKIIKKITEHQFSNYLELIYYGLNNDKITNKNTLSSEISDYIADYIDFKIKF